MSSYLVAGTIAAPVYGQLRDVYGGKRMMFVALGIFLAASLLCAVSTSVEMLSLARILQGLGGGGLMTLSQALIGETIPPRERARYQGYLAAVMVSSSVFGPVAGGYLTHHFGWRSVFLINLPLGVMAAVLTLRLPSRPAREQPWAFDGLGLVLFVGFIVPALLALEQAQRMSASTLPTMLVLAAVAVAALVALVYREKRAPFPLLPISLLRQATIWRSDALAACHGATLVSLVTFPAALSARRARQLGVRNRPAAAAADVRHRRGLDDHGPHRQPHRPDRDIPLRRTGVRDPRADHLRAAGPTA